MPSTVPEIDRPSPGSWSVEDRDTANHEAGHSVIATILGRTVVEVRIDRPLDDHKNLRGVSRSMHDPEASMADLEKELLSTLAGSHAEGKPLALPPEGETSDAKQARSLGLILGFESVDWFIIGLRLEMLLERPSTRRALRAVSRALLERGAIDGAEVERLVEEAEDV